MPYESPGARVTHDARPCPADLVRFMPRQVCDRQPDPSQRRLVPRERERERKRERKNTLAMSEERATAALVAAGIDHTIVRHGPVNSLAEAARARGVAPSQVVKTLVVRRGEDDYLFILVPGDRQISWPKLRALVSANRLSMPSADTARDVTGYERGTITPFGALRAWPVIADVRIHGAISIGAGAQGVSALTAATDVIETLSATVADVTAPQALDDA